MFKLLLTYPVEPLIKEAAEVLGLPPEVVKKVVNFEFKVISDNYKTWQYVGFRFEDLGSIVVRPKALDRVIEHLILKARRYPDKHYKKVLHNA